MMLVIVEFRLQPDAEEMFERTLEEMHERIRRYDGFLGEEACQAMSDASKFVSLFRFTDRNAVEAWRNDEVHRRAQALAKSEVFSWYQITVAEVERAYEFSSG